MKRTLAGGVAVAAMTLLGAGPALACHQPNHGHKHHNHNGGKAGPQPTQHHSGHGQGAGDQPGHQGGVPLPGTPVPPPSHSHQGGVPKPHPCVCEPPTPRHNHQGGVPRPHPTAPPVKVHPRPPVITHAKPTHHKSAQKHTTRVVTTSHIAALPRTGVDVASYLFAGGALVALGMTLTLAGSFRRQSGRAR
jgi:hypothetical protein